MRVALTALALIVGMPVIGSSQANATWRDSSYYGRGYAHYGYAPQYRYYGSRHHRGIRHYRSGRPESYRTGSRRWWGAMDREDRGGRGRH